jgi:membrane protein CcdC involved in cytochrome C biogenesis
LLLAVLLAEDHPILSGIALGLTFSKITLIFPFLLFFLWRRKFIPLVVAVCVHFLGLILISLPAGDGFAGTWEIYFRILTRLTDAIYGGINLPAQFGVAPLAAALSTLIPWTETIEWTTNILPELLVIAAGGLLILFLLVRQQKILRNPNSFSGPRLTILELELLTIISIVNLLTVYHRIYDAVLIVLLFPLLFIWWCRIGSSRGSIIRKTIYLAFVAVMLVLLLFPMELESFLSNNLGLNNISRFWWEPVMLTYGLILALILSLTMHFIPCKHGKTIANNQQKTENRKQAKPTH